MDYQVYKLCFSTAVHFGDSQLTDAQYILHADTIFSAMCQEFIKLQQGDIEEFVNKFRDNRLVISDAFPFIKDTLYIPKPMISISAEEGKSGDSIIKKAYKKLNFIPAELLTDYLCGKLDAVAELSKFRELGNSQVRTLVSIRGEEDSMPFRVGTYSFKENCGLYIIVGYEDESDLDIIGTLLEAIGYVGIGGKRSSGLGRFDCKVAKMPESLTEKIGNEKKDAYYMTLSVALPTESEIKAALADANYKLIKRSGFSQTKDLSEAKRKNDLYVCQAGSCFGIPFMGDIYDVNNGEKHPVYRYAKPMMMEVGK